MLRKGVSPIIATVLLIAFTVGVAGIVSVWLTTFAKTSTENVEKESKEELTCVYGGIALSSLKFANGNISGNIENTRQISIGSITLQIVYSNASINTTTLCLAGSRAVWCPTANLSLTPREIASFNVSSGTGSKSDITKLRVYTNCSSVFDEADSSEIS